MDGATREMLQCDENELSFRFGEAEELLRRHYGPQVKLTGTRADLALIQRALDDRLPELSRPVVLQTLGLALGNVLAHELGFEWIIHEDDYGADPALRDPRTDRVVHPLTLLSGDDDRVDLAALLRALHEPAQPGPAAR